MCCETNQRMRCSKNTRPGKRASPLVSVYCIWQNCHPAKRDLDKTTKSDSNDKKLYQFKVIPLVSVYMAKFSSR